MQEYRKDEIIYDEDWQRFDEPSTAEGINAKDNDIDAKTEPEPKKKEKTPLSLITLQLILCIIIAFVLFMLKAMDSDTYKAISEWYDEQMKSTIVASKKFEDIDLSRYFEASFDEFHSTVDES